MNPEPHVIFENDDFLVIDKPSGLQVHHARVAVARADGREPEMTLADWLVEHRPGVSAVGDDPAIRPGIVHRLDKETSGVMIVAKNQKTFEALKSLFQERRMTKAYAAAVDGILKNKEGVIDAPIGMKSGTLKRSIHAATMAKPAVTDYRVTDELGAERFAPNGASLLEVHPRTGRTHQIRVHLASIGHPVLGDRLYGPKRASPGIARLMLHARALSFSLAGTQYAFEAELPREFGALFQISTG
ncbi:MAG TPA: RluA family pseudouridine synthase [Candidatus Paceibacterota bacterium]|nr:RluA family pseudouridine synthase [Candidatus Paceibacterota bacterium]